MKVFLTGASSGIGEALARHYAGRGATVGLVARRRAMLEALAAGLPSPSTIHEADVRDAQAMRAAAADFIVRHGLPDLVIANAGVSHGTLTEYEGDADVFRQILEINVLGLAHAFQPFVGPMREAGRGTLVVVASVAGYRGLPKSLVYGPTKAALINMAETMYLDLAPRGVAVSVVNPGFVKTPLTAQNEFEMPHIITPEEAAAEMLAGYGRGEFEIHFPKAFSRKLKLLRLLPYGMYFNAIRKSTGL